MNQSGASHSMTLHEPLRVQQTAERTFIIRGTPTDCVIMGVRHFMLDHPPDLVLSGINHGSNLARGRHLFGHHRRRHRGHACSASAPSP